MRHVIIIPTLEPTARIIGLVDDLRTQGFEHIVVVDDGSDEDIFSPIFDALEGRGCEVLHHGANFGKGVAIKTGIAYARQTHPDAPGYVTVDGDGQHLACDVRLVAERAAQAPGTIVMGVRDFSQRGVPLRSKVGNTLSSWAFALACGAWCPDTQTGLRAIPRSLAEEAIQCPGERFEYETAFLMQMMQRKRPIEYAGIATVYLDGNSGSHFDAIHDTARIVRTAFSIKRSGAALRVQERGSLHAA